MIREAAVYFARTIAVRPEMMDEYLLYVRDVLRPIWIKAHDTNELESLDVIRLIRSIHADEGIADWNLVQVGRVPDAERASTFLDRLATEGSTLDHGLDPEAYCILKREEILRTTPRAHSPDHAPSVSVGRSSVRLSVEVIDVNDNKADLERYRQLMGINAGPAIRNLRDKGLVYNFVPLETEEVRFASPDMPSWNQLHILGLIPETAESFVEHFDRALREVNPDSGGYEGYFGTLDGLRHRPRWSIGRWITDLSVRRH